MTSSVLPRYRAGFIEQFQRSETCQKCESTMLYHDFDPHHFHNGITCLMCGTEQLLTTGTKSLLDPNKPKLGSDGRRRRGPSHGGQQL